MSPGLLVLIIAASFIVLLLLGLPIAFALISLSVVYILIFVKAGVLTSLYLAGFRMTMADVYVAIPMFVFMACALQFSGVAERMYDVMYKWFAGMRGGLAIGTIAICTVIAAMTGLAATAIVTMGLLAYPEMKKKGYADSIALGCIPAGGALGPIIPPSVIMIIIGGFAGVSVGKMFMGGVVPGLLMSFLFMVYIAVRCHLQPNLAPALPPEERATWKEKFTSLTGVLAPIALIVLVLGSIYTGAATPTEAGGVGATGALVCALIYRRLNWTMLQKTATTSLRITVMCVWLLVAGASFSALLSVTGISQYINTSVLGLSLGPWAILAVMLFLTLIMGMFIDATSCCMILLPIFVPIVGHLGVDLLWFSLVFSVTVVVGLVTPPFAINVFYLKGVLPPEVTIGQIYRSTNPFVAPMLIVLFVGIVWPPLFLWLPGLME